MSFDAPEPSEHKRTGHNWFDLFISICALVTSALSMYVAYNNDQSLERLVHANSWPFLQTGNGNAGDDGTPMLIFQVKNAGTGPARVYTFEYLVDGKPIAQENPTIRIGEACCDSAYRTTIAQAPEGHPYDAIGSVMTNRVAPGVLAAHDSIVTMQWLRTQKNLALWTAIDVARREGRLTTRTCYCSVFDECWIAQSDTLPTPVHGMCPMPHGHNQSTMPGPH